MTEQASDTAELQKARGAFFTPPTVTEFLAQWAIRSGSDRVLEPSCGDGAFLSAASLRLARLGGGGMIRGHEIHAGSAAQAEGLLRALAQPGEIHVGDFLASPAEATFDAVVGNPPYVRYQGFTGEARATGRAAALAQGVRLSNLASSWAPFVIHAAGHLRPTGRLGLVLPAELLTSNYAQGVRDFLLRRFAEIRVIRFGRHVFPGVQTEALLLLAEGGGQTDRLHFAALDDAAQLGQVAFPTTVEAQAGKRWIAGLVSADAQDGLDNLVASGGFAALSAWGRLSLGAVTGNNRFFTLSPAEAGSRGLAPSDVVPISPAGSSHLRALTLTKHAHDELGQQGAKTLLFRPDQPSGAALAYIAHGESTGVQHAYKCRVRAPWWRTPLPAPPDLFFTYMNHATPQLAANPDRFHYLNSVHGLYLKPGHADLAPLLALAALNTATALSAEVTGRAYGGGVLKLEPREAAQLLVPSVATVRSRQAELRAALPVAATLLRDGRLTDARHLVDGLVLDVGAVEDDLLFGLRAAHEAFSQRRHGRARSRADRGREHSS